MSFDAFREKPVSEKKLGGRTVSQTNAFEATRAHNLLNLDAAQKEFLKKDPELANAINSLIDSVDMGSLQSIFQEYAVKSGVSRERVNRIAREKIFLVTHVEGSGEDAIMGYFNVANAVQIDGKKFEQLRNNVGNTENILGFLRLLFHEFAHATSRNECTMTDTIFNRTNVNVSGIRETVESLMIPGFPSKKVEVYVFLNEGITELIAGEVFAEYIRRHPLDDVSSVDVSKTIFRSMVKNGTYSIAQDIVLSIVNEVRKDMGVSKDVVWRSFMRQYYSGELQTQEFSNALSTVFDRKFVERLRSAHTLQELDELDLDLFDGSVDKKMEWLKHIDTSRGAL